MRDTTKFRDLHKNVKTRLVTGFLDRLITQLIVPFMAIYLNAHFGGGLAGVMIALSVVLAMLSGLYGGYWANLFGRKTVMLQSEISRMIALALMAACNSPWVKLPFFTFLLFIILLVSSSISLPANDAMIIDVSTPETRKYIYTTNYWITNLSLALGTSIGAFLYKNHFFGLLLFCSAASLAMYIIIRVFIMESYKRDNYTGGVKAPSIIEDYKVVARDTLFMSFCVLAVLNSGLEMQLPNYISVRLSRQFGLHQLFHMHGGIISINGVEMFGILGSENTILVVVLAFVVNSMCSRMRNTHRLSLGTLIFTIGYMVLAVDNSPWILMSMTLFYTLGELMYVPVKQKVLADLVSDDARSQYMAVYGLNSRFGLLIASFCISLGTLVSSWAISGLYALMGIAILLIYRHVLTPLACTGSN